MESSLGGSDGERAEAALTAQLLCAHREQKLPPAALTESRELSVNFPSIPGLGLGETAHDEPLYCSVKLRIDPLFFCVWPGPVPLIASSRFESPFTPVAGLGLGMSDQAVPSSVR